MKLADLKKYFGDEYPAAVITDGIRMPLRWEKRFSRFYSSDKPKLSHGISRFMDGSASITASDLQQEWPGWEEDIRMDFCESCSWLHEQHDFPEMLRFIMQHGGHDHWSAIALNVASQLPRDEAFNFLVRALHSMDIGSSANVEQAIAMTKHPDADATLRSHLATLWRHPALWDNADFMNWVGFDAVTCIAHLIELGASPADFNEQARKLSEHACSGNQESCRNHLSMHYSWLK
jgi:hypothetical protein